MRRPCAQYAVRVGSAFNVPVPGVPLVRVFRLQEARFAKSFIKGGRQEADDIRFGDILRRVVRLQYGLDIVGHAWGKARNHGRICSNRRDGR